ncbi:MAG: hypothetical protein JXR05_16485 [Flavobacteriaceae bacterium]
MKEEELYFKLLKVFIEYYRKTMKDLEEHPEFELGQNNHHLLTDEAKKVSRISDFMSRLSGLISDIDKVIVFVRRFPSKTYYESNDMNQLDFIKYHFEVFIHKIHTILEVKKLLINDFYELGFENENCSWNNLKKHKKIKTSEVKKIVENYHETFKHLIELRHINTHRGIFNDKKNNDLNNDLFIYKGFEKFGLDIGDDFRKIRPKFIVDYQIKEYRKERLKYIKEGREIANNYINQILTIILAEFFEKKLNKD